MARPVFTKAEEHLIRELRNQVGSGKVWLQYLSWLIPAVILFAFGVWAAKPYPSAVGFGMVLYLLVRYIVYQCRPDWKVIVEKYEAAMKEPGQHPSAS